MQAPAMNPHAQQLLGARSVSCDGCDSNACAAAFYKAAHRPKHFVHGNRVALLAGVWQNGHSHRKSEKCSCGLHAGTQCTAVRDTEYDIFCAGFPCQPSLPVKRFQDPMIDKGKDFVSISKYLMRCPKPPKAVLLENGLAVAARRLP
jgi:Site-specific DNA methylase